MHAYAALTYDQIDRACDLLRAAFGGDPTTPAAQANPLCAVWAALDALQRGTACLVLEDPVYSSAFHPEGVSRAVEIVEEIARTGPLLISWETKEGVQEHLEGRPVLAALPELSFERLTDLVFASLRGTFGTSDAAGTALGNEIDQAVDAHLGAFATTLRAEGLLP